jgi:hypothetical protein
MKDKEIETDWTPAERDRLNALPRESEPAPALKARIADALYRQGILAGPERVRTPRSSASRWTLRAAATAAVFVAGALAGHMTATEGSSTNFVPSTSSTLAPAERVQRSGSSYVESVADLVGALGSVSPETAGQGREVALSALRGAAEYVVRLPGHDPDVERLLFELRAAEGP